MSEPPGGITLSSSTRQNLLSLQNTFQLIGRTHERLAMWLRMSMTRLAPQAKGVWRVSLHGEPITAKERWLFHPEQNLRGGFSEAWAFDAATATLTTTCA